MTYYIDIEEIMLLMRMIRKETFLESLQMWFIIHSFYFIKYHDCNAVKHFFSDPPSKRLSDIRIVMHAFAHVKQIFKIRL